MNNKIIKTILLFFVLLFSVGLISATDDLNTEEVRINEEYNVNNVYDLNNDKLINEDLSPSNAETYNFTWLNNSIYENSSDSFIDLGGNSVKWNDTGLFTNGIVINKNVTIKNGTIDASNSVRIFNITNTGNLILDGITLQNGYVNSNGGAIYNMGELTISNANFYNNKAISGGAIYNRNGFLGIEDSAFINNTANDTGAYAGGSAIYSGHGNFELDNGTFIANTAIWGTIYLFDSNATINNSLFINTTNKYAGAIFSGDSYLELNNSNFINIHSNESGGAIALRRVDSKEEILTGIFNSNFINCSSKKNGGAIYSDKTTFYLIDSNFINCSSNFGGALTILEEFSYIENSNFINNYATYDGGAIYTSFNTMTLVQSYFASNKVDSNENERGSSGGALFLDFAIVEIYDSRFINNSATREGGAIYLYDGTHKIYNNFFYTNSALNGSGVYGDFTDNITLINNTFNNDTVSLNNTPFAYIMVGNGTVIQLVNNSIILTNFPSRFDLRDFGWVSSVKDQGFMGACWTFGSLGALESALLKATDIEYDFSENNMQNAMLRYSVYGNILMDEGGFNTASLGYLVSWFGAFPTIHDTYDELGKISPLYISDIHIQDVIIIPGRKNSTDNDLIKSALLKYGSLEVIIFFDGNSYNRLTHAFYNNGTLDGAHSVSLVGWDDNYSKNNFLNTPPEDGAFIVKNSWGDGWADGGFFYVSYYDVFFASYNSPLGFIINNTVNYNKNYQYDITGFSKYFSSNSTYIYYSNQFESISEDLIAAVGTYFPEYINDYELQVFVNDELKYTQIGQTDFPGFATIKLNKYIPIKEGDIFKVVMKTKQMPIMEDITSPVNPNSTLVSRVHLQANNSFLSYDGENWEDLYDYSATACLKVYTVEYNSSGDVILNSSDIIMYYKDGTKYIASLTDFYGTPLVNYTLKITVNNVEYTRITDENGSVSLSLNLLPNNYTIITYFNGSDLYFNNSITTSLAIKSTILSKDLVKYYLNNSQYEVLVYNTNGTPLFNASLEININGVIYTRTTDTNGIARLNINLKPGNYIITVNYNGLNISNSIIVKPTLIANDLIKTFTESATYDVLVLGNVGQVLANQEIIINIHGVIYNRTTDSNGIAKLNINLDPGSYIATAYWNDYATSNIITVKN